MNRPVAEWMRPISAASEDWQPFSGSLLVQEHGGKAANLGRMVAAGLPVPEGHVFGIGMLHGFLAETGLSSRIDALRASLPDCDGASLADVEAQVRSWFDAAGWPASLAVALDDALASMSPDVTVVVRSSAVGEDGMSASYAGLMDSLLGVRGRASIESAIKRVWASRWSARALGYERTHGELGAVAVIIQRQIAPIVAGVLFTRSPDRNRDDEMLCEYCSGLADRLVSGEITPGRLHIDRATSTTTERTVPQGIPDMSDRSVRRLASLASRIEELFGGPQDIEFAIDAEDNVWIVQARPITTATPRVKRVVWSNANVNENFPDPISPLLYSIVAPGYSAYFGNLGRAFGLSPARLAGMRSDLAAIVGVHAGRLYYNLSAIHSVLAQAPFGDRLCAWFDEFTGASDPSRTAHAGSRSFVRGLRDVAELGWIVARIVWQYAFIERRMRAFEARIDAYAQAASPSRLPTLDTNALRDLLRDFLDIRLHRWTDASLADTAAMVCYGVLKALVGKCKGRDAGQVAHHDLLKGLSGLKSAEPVEALWALARWVNGDQALRRLLAEHDPATALEHIRTDVRFGEFAKRFDAYLECWGFRCSAELMLTVESFQERPADLLDIVRCYAEQSHTAPESRLGEQRVAREAATRQLLAAGRSKPLLGRFPWPTLATVLRPAVTATQAAIGLRERARLKQALLYSRLRRVALEVGARLVARGSIARAADVFMLTLPELDELLSGHAMFPDEVARLVELRRRAHERFDQAQPPDVIISAQGEYPNVGAERNDDSADGDRLAGLSVCGGQVVGRAKVLTDVAQTRSLCKGDVLVTRQTDPGWAPAFVLIGGLVLERGGMLSHGAILAREYGIPTVVGVQDASTRITTGRRIAVDGDRGQVSLLDD